MCTAVSMEGKQKKALTKSAWQSAICHTSGQLAAAGTAMAANAVGPWVRRRSGGLGGWINRG